MAEQRIWAPEWLELSGLPEWLNTKVRQGAWTVFRKLVETDCQANFKPAPFEISITDLARRTGLKVEIVERILKALHKKRVVSSFIPDHPDERALCQISTPIPLPASRDKILAALPREMVREELRYLDRVEPTGDSDAVMREIVDAYMNLVSHKMNPIILDELRLLSLRFSKERLRRAFSRAKYVGVDSLSWVTRELIREDARGKKTETQDR